MDRECWDIQIDINKIPEEKCREVTHKNGEVDIRCRLTLMPMRLENIKPWATHMVVLKKSKDEQDAGEPTIFVGTAKQTAIW